MGAKRSHRGSKLDLPSLGSVDRDVESPVRLTIDSTKANAAPPATATDAASRIGSDAHPYPAIAARVAIAI